MNLSRDFTLPELLRSDRFQSLVPLADDFPYQCVIMLSRLAAEVLQPIRNELAVPVRVLSGYRSPELNRAVRGSQYSRHQIDVRGKLFAAADIMTGTVPAESIFNMLAVAGRDVLFDRVCLYPGMGFVHVDIHDWHFGPPARRYYVDTGGGWLELSRHDAARSSW